MKDKKNKDIVHFVTYKDIIMIFGTDLEDCLDDLKQKLSDMGVHASPNLNDYEHGPILANVVKDILSK